MNHYKTYTKWDAAGPGGCAVVVVAAVVEGERKPYGP